MKVSPQTVKKKKRERGESIVLLRQETSNESFLIRRDKKLSLEIYILKMSMSKNTFCISHMIIIF